MKRFTGVLVLAGALLIALAAFVMSKDNLAKKTTMVSAAAATTAMAAPMAGINKPAPNFSLVGADGKKYSLADFKGKWVVLEWVNFGCPFVRKHYDSKNMQNLQKDYVAKDVVWLSICSSAPEKQGYFKGAELLAKIKENGINSTAYLIDADGKVGHMYDAKTTPSMYIVNPQGMLVYAGAIDDKPSTKAEDITAATNYVKAALDAAMAGKMIMVSSTPSYGCSVKY